MKVEIKITKQAIECEEFKTLEHFLLWQNVSYNIEVTLETLKYSMGRSNIHIIILTSDNKPMVGFNGFNGFYKWFDNSGNMLC